MERVQLLRMDHSVNPEFVDAFNLNAIDAQPSVSVQLIELEVFCSTLGRYLVVMYMLNPHDPHKSQCDLAREEPRWRMLTMSLFTLRPSIFPRYISSASPMHPPFI